MTGFNGTKSIREIAKELGTGFQRSGDRSNFLDFIEAEEKAAQSKIASIVCEQNRLMREIAKKKRLAAVRAERQRLQKEPTTEIYSVVPHFTLAQIPPEMTQEQIAEVLRSAISAFRNKIEISKADWTLLLNFMSVNEINAMDVAVWEKALQFIIDRLTSIEQGGPLPEKPVTQQAEPQEPKNPYPQSSHPQSAHFLWEMNNLHEQQYAEVLPLVRETLEPIIKNDARDFEGASIRHLVDTLRKKNLVINRDNIRAKFLAIWGKEMTEASRQAAFTEQELSDWKNEIEDRYLSSEQIKMKYKYGRKI
jgi:hypothetical protein